jgi:dynactin complex subunit
MSVKLQSIQEENSRLKDDLDQKEEELRGAMDKMGQVNGEITRMKGIVEENDKEMRRQMENASKKIDKYKEQVRDKQA